jgi:endonuclease/exonuclease/phosphatase family metal-dependent hydrolase
VRQSVPRADSRRKAAAAATAARRPSPAAPSGRDAFAQPPGARAHAADAAMRFTVATYNIHKGFSHFNRRVVIHELREKLHGLAADLLFLQEVIGVHERHACRFQDWPLKPQHEYIADQVWHEVAYGKNCVYRDGHHGNALLSRFPITSQENEDISAHAFESRGMLHCVVKPGGGLPEIHCLNVHLGLFERGRQWQIRALCERIRALVPKDAPLIIAGDFNDWRHKANRLLVDTIGVEEVFESFKGRPARTFPSVMPVFRLDRIYARGLRVVDATVWYAFPGARLSDHAALAATFELPAPV